MRNWLLLGFAGMLGVLARHFVQTHVPRWGNVPFGTFLVNVSGAFAIGLIAGLVVHRFSPPMWVQETLTVGFLGGYTTFSALSLETVLFMDRGQYVIAGAYSLGSLVSGVVAVLFGLWLGQR